MISCSMTSGKTRKGAHLEDKALLVVVDVEDAFHAVNVLRPHFEQRAQPQVELVQVHRAFNLKACTRDLVIVDGLVMHMRVPMVMVVAMVVLMAVAVAMVMARLSALGMPLTMLVLMAVALSVAVAMVMARLSALGMPVTVCVSMTVLMIMCVAMAVAVAMRVAVVMAVIVSV